MPSFFITFILTIMPRKSLTIDKLSKDLNFFHGYVGELVVEFFDKSYDSIINFVNKYEQEDCNIVYVEDDDEEDNIFHIYAYGEKQIRSLCDIMNNDFDIAYLSLKSLTES